MPDITEYGEIVLTTLDEWGRFRIDSLLEDGTKIIPEVVEVRSTIAAQVLLEKTKKTQFASISQLETSSFKTISGLGTLEIEKISSLAGLLILETERVRTLGGLSQLETEKLSAWAGLGLLETKWFSTTACLAILEPERVSTLANLISLETEKLSALAGLPVLETEKIGSFAGFVEIEFYVETFASITNLEAISLPVPSQPGIFAFESRLVETKTFLINNPIYFEFPFRSPSGKLQDPTFGKAEILNDKGELVLSVPLLKRIDGVWYFYWTPSVLGDYLLKISGFVEANPVKIVRRLKIVSSKGYLEPSGTAFESRRIETKKFQVNNTIYFEFPFRNSNGQLQDPTLGKAEILNDRNEIVLNVSLLKRIDGVWYFYWTPTTPGDYLLKVSGFMEANPIEIIRKLKVISSKT